MAIYHFSGTIISRSQGRSAVACAAYRAGDRLYDERYDKTHDYSRKMDVAHSEILLPENAPAWMGNREQLWNTVEAVEKRKDSQLAREVEISLPRELTLEQNLALVKEFVSQEYVSKGMVADIGIHVDKATDGGLQPHAHVMLTMREITIDGFGQKVREWNAKENLLHWREAWAEVANRHLFLAGHDLKIDHRTLQAQGIDLEPQHKIGAAVVQERKARFEDHQRIARENGEKILADPSIALDAITRQQSTFTHQDLARFINRHTHDAEQFQHVYEAVKNSDQIVYLGKDDKDRERFTTHSQQAIETRMMDNAVHLAQREGHAVSLDAKTHALASRSLTPQQRDVFDYLLEKGDLKAVNGYAGTGKSYLLGAAREAWEKQGYRVLGASLSGVAAQNLEGSSGIESRTIASYLYAWERGRDPLTAHTVFVIDEAGMLGSRQTDLLLDEIRRSGAKAVTVGDIEQLQAIEAGGAHRAICERVGYIELTEIRRQREEWQQEATREFATGRTVEALNRYHQHDHVHAYENDTHAKQAMISLWNDVRLNNPNETQIMLAYTRKDVQELNTLARDLRQVHGELGENHSLDTARGIREFAENDRIYFLKNERSLGVKNGTLGTIEQIHHKELTVRLDTDERQPHTPARTVKVNLDHYNHVDHGYAATIHKAQGVTVDRSYLLVSTHMDRHATYVAGSRHRDSVDIFYSRETFADEKAVAQTLSRERLKDVSLDYRPDELTRTPDEPTHDYQQARERFESNTTHKQTVLDRVEARREAKLLQLEVDRLTKEYSKPMSRELIHGEQGHYRETVNTGKHHYAVIEKDNAMKLVPLEKGMEKYEGRTVKIEVLCDEKQQRNRIHLEPTRERSISGKSRGDDVELSR